MIDVDLMSGTFQILKWTVEDGSSGTDGWRILNNGRRFEGTHFCNMLTTFSWPFLMGMGFVASITVHQCHRPAGLGECVRCQVSQSLVRSRLPQISRIKKKLYSAVPSPTA